MLIIFLLLTATFILHSIAYLDKISFNSGAESAIDTSNATNITTNMEQRQIRIFQQGMFNLDRTLTPTITAQDYVISLDIASKYTFNNSSKTLIINNNMFTGNLFGIENLAAMHEPQIQMILDNIHNFTVSSDLKTINYDLTFINADNLTARVVGILQFQNLISFDNVVDRQGAISNVSVMQIKMGTIPLIPIKSSPGMEINLMSID